jgi:hypothetical protein
LRNPEIPLRNPEIPLTETGKLKVGKSDNISNGTRSKISKNSTEILFPAKAL